MILYILFNLHINPDVIERGLQLSGEKTNFIPPQDWLFCQAWMSKLYLLFRIIICTWWVTFIHTTINSYYLIHKPREQNSFLIQINSRWHIICIKRYLSSKPCFLNKVAIMAWLDLLSKRLTKIALQPSVELLLVLTDRFHWALVRSLLVDLMQIYFTTQSGFILSYLLYNKPSPGHTQPTHCVQF